MPEQKPTSWPDRRSRIRNWRRPRNRWKLPLVWTEWVLERIVHKLSRWAVIDLARLGASLAIIWAGVQFVVGYDEARESARKQKHYQAWQVINSAAGTGGSGGRIDALEDLAGDGVSLAGVHLSGAYLHDIDLPDAHLSRAAMDSVWLAEANLSGAVLFHSDLSGANLGGANLSGAVLTRADLRGAGLVSADLSRASLGWADLSAIYRWENISSLDKANLRFVVNPPEGFLSWAVHEMGAVCVGLGKEHDRILDGTIPVPEHPQGSRLAAFCRVRYSDQANERGKR